ncbi:MAG: ATP-binding protein, partial [Bdellovibrionales bacterium]|nr:ATP-binding protein [Bdellovibrionales bacterium]
THKMKVCKIRMEKVAAPVYATSILQVLVNVMINAIHAMGTSGQIDVSVQQVDDVAEVVLRDYGPGIAPELIEKVREPFFTTKGEKGTGLGLSISAEIVEMEHLGQFALKNHGVKGLEVTISLPLKKEG